MVVVGVVVVRELFPGDISDLCTDQRLRVGGYNSSLSIWFRFSSIAVSLPEWIRSTGSMLFVK